MIIRHNRRLDKENTEEQFGRRGVAVDYCIDTVSGYNLPFRICESALVLFKCTSPRLIVDTDVNAQYRLPILSPDM